MKKFLKILLIVIGIVFLIFAALICIGLFRSVYKGLHRVGI